MEILSRICLFSLFPSLLLSTPDGHGGYEIVKIEATQTSNPEAGERKSTSRLRIVKPDDGKASAQLLATGSGRKPQEEPVWNSVDGLKAEVGSLTGSCSSNKNVEITASASDGEASVSIDISDPVTQEIRFTKETTGLKDFEEKITDWLTRFGKTPTWTISGELAGEGRKCDFHNDGEKLGHKAMAKGSLAIKAPQIKGETPGIPVMAGAVFVSGEASFNPFTVTASLSFDYNEEKKDPWLDPVKGSVSVGAGGSVGLKASAGKKEVAEVYAKGSISISLTGSANFDTQERNVRLASGSAKFGELKGKAEVGAKALGGQWEFWSGSVTLWIGDTYDIPGLPKVVYTIPQ